MAPSLPGTGVRVEGIERPDVQLTDLVQGDGGATIFRPSGETATSAHWRRRLLGKDDLEADRERLLRRSRDGRHGESDGRPRPAAEATAAAIQPSGSGARATGSDREAHARACFSSRTDCQRSAGSLARQVSTTCSSAGGVVGFRAEIGAGSRSRIAAITLAALLPSKACWPVSIS